jgi:acetylornithine deacetylase/succinyl-diaminopimelate desuccinylase-like protein
MHLLDSGLVAPSMALVSDTTSLEIAHAHRGFVQLGFDLDVPAPAAIAFGADHVTWTVTVLGVPAHTASPGLGRNALTTALAYARRLIDLGGRVFDLDAPGVVERVPDRCRFVAVLPQGVYPPLPGALVEWGGEPKREVTSALVAFSSAAPRIRSLLRWSTPARDDDFLPLGASGVFTSAQTLGADEPMMTRLTLGLEVRPRPDEAVETLMRDLEGVVRRAAAEWHGLGTLRVERQLLPFDGRPDSALAAAVRKVSHHPTTVGTHAGFTEAWVYQSVNIDTAVYGPGSLAVRGRPNEYAVLTQLDAAYRLYGRLVKEICL